MVDVLQPHESPVEISKLRMANGLVAGEPTLASHLRRAQGSQAGVALPGPHAAVIGAAGRRWRG